MIRVGCCGFGEAQQKYFAEFPAVEIQTAFYQPPRPETARGWRERAPGDFEFTLKAWQLITHEPSSPTYRRLTEKIPPLRLKQCGSFKPTDEVFRAWERTEEIARALGSKIIVFQCPASFAPTAVHKRNLRSFFKKIPRRGYLFAWEPRGDWTPDGVKALCEELDLTHCVDPFKNAATHGRIRYYRLHGITGYGYRFTDDDLGALKAHCEGRRDVYCLFNNATMLEDARRFSKISGERP
jgi:uncharacterized protein YecE (DUF72 family)